MDALASLVDRASNSIFTAAPPSFLEQQYGKQILTAWLALNLAGQATLPFLVLTMLFHKKITRRNPTIINLCIVWTLGTIPPLLLFYGGKHTGPKPDTLMCLAQAATVSAVPPMASVAYLAVVIHACTVINSIINANTVRPISFDYRIILLISAPYVTFMTFSLLIAIVGALNPGDVQRVHLYCQVLNHRLSLPVFGFSIIVVILTLVAQIWISVMFYRNWSAKRNGRVEHSQMSHVDFSFLIRMLFFTLFEVVILVSCVGAVLNPGLGALSILLATPPFAVFLIFASSQDIVRAWFPCFFRRKRTRSLADTTSQVPIIAGFDEKHSKISHSNQSSVSSLTRPITAAIRPRQYDLEWGTPPDSPYYPAKPRRETTENTTMVSVYPASSGPLSPLSAIRSLRTPTVPRPVLPR